MCRDYKFVQDTSVLHTYNYKMTSNRSISWYRLSITSQSITIASTDKNYLLEYYRWNHHCRRIYFATRFKMKCIKHLTRVLLSQLTNVFEWLVNILVRQRFKYEVNHERVTCTHLTYLGLVNVRVSVHDVDRAYSGWKITHVDNVGFNFEHILTHGQLPTHSKYLTFCQNRYIERIYDVLWLKNLWQMHQSEN